MENFTVKRFVARSVKKLKNCEEFAAVDVAELSKNYAVLYQRNEFAEAIHTVTTNHTVSFFQSSPCGNDCD